MESQRTPKAETPSCGCGTPAAQDPGPAPSCCPPAEKTAAKPRAASCCGSSASDDRGAAYERLDSEGHITTPGGDIPRVPATLSFRDKLGGWKVRWGLRRMKYMVEPGLYAVGRPTETSPVLVSANYKYSFDSLRKVLTGRDAWILVLDTKGINVWCAAGKGTFGTEEVIRRVEAASLDTVVSHRKLILPELGAPGVAAHEVQKRTRFRVVYGPVRAADLPAFLDAGMSATPEMRRVRFGIRERAKLVPEEIIPAMPILLVLAAIQAMLSWVSTGRVSILDIVGLLGAVLAGSVLVPLLLPWIPVRAFAFKGWVMGVVWTLALQAFAVGALSQPFLWSRILMGLLLWPAVSAYVAMNFTGSSTFTSLSGVVKEMSRAVPLMLTSVSLYVVVFVVRIFVRSW